MEEQMHDPAELEDAPLVDRIRADIAGNGFLPGSRITEAALAERYGTSRTPVREALRMLTQERLLDHVPNWGHRVVRLQLRDLDDLYAVRIGIEVQSVRRLAEGSGDLAPVHQLLARWNVPPIERHPDVNLVFTDEAFHEGLAAAAGGTVLLASLRTVNHRLHGLRMREFIDADRVQRTYDQHTSILRAILAADSTLATALMTSHVLEGQRYVRHSAIALDLLAPQAADGDGHLETAPGQNPQPDELVPPSDGPQP